MVRNASAAQARAGTSASRTLAASPVSQDNVVSNKPAVTSCTARLKTGSRGSVTRVAASDPAAQHAVADRMAAAPFGLKLPPDAELQPSNAVPKKADADAQQFPPVERLPEHEPGEQRQVKRRRGPEHRRLAGRQI